MPEKEHIKPEAEGRDREYRIPPLGQATGLTPVVSGNHHLSTAPSRLTTGHLGRPQLPLEHLSFQVSKQNTTPSVSHREWTGSNFLFLNHVVKKNLNS